MKIEVNVAEPQFEPVKLTITFETQEEISKFYSLFNHSALVDWFNRPKAVAMRESLESYRGSYSVYHTELCKIIK